MKSKLLIIIFLFVFLKGQSQVLTYKNTPANPVDTACINNNNVNVLWLPQWEVYQTYNDMWDGPRDTTLCTDAFDSTGFAGGLIDFNAVDNSRIVFFRLKTESMAPIILDSNNIFKFELFSYSSANLLLDTVNQCNGGNCTGILTGIEIPDSAGLGNSMRWTDTKIQYQPLTCVYNMYCIPTEYFYNNNVLKEFIVKVKGAGNNLNQVFKILDLAVYQNMDKPNQLYDSTDFIPYNVGPLNYTLVNFSTYIQDFLVLHDSTTYPNANQISYIDVYPIPNTSNQSIINIDVLGSLYFQPFAELRGGLIAGGTQRHNINLQLSGGNICLTGFVEVMFTGGNKFTYNKGEINFLAHNACMAFGDGGELNVAENSIFDYGKQGIGMMALRTGAKINIASNSSLVIHNHINMYEYSYDATPQNIYMTLNKGSKLIFAPGSQLTNWFSKDSTMQLVVTLNGGELDDSGLSNADKKLIKRVYPPTVNNTNEQLLIFNSGNDGKLTFKYKATNAGGITYTVYAGNGSIIYQSYVTTSQGENIIVCDFVNKSHSTYVLDVNDGVSKVSQQFFY
nr:hypothetical protein [Bacteroidota bacterium]